MATRINKKTGKKITRKTPRDSITLTNKETGKVIKLKRKKPRTEIELINTETGKKIKLKRKSFLELLKEKMIKSKKKPKNTPMRPMKGNGNMFAKSKTKKA